MYYIVFLRYNLHILLLSPPTPNYANSKYIMTMIKKMKVAFSLSVKKCNENNFNNSLYISIVFTS